MESRTITVKACSGKYPEAESTRLRCRQTGQNFNQERNLGRSTEFLAKQGEVGSSGKEMAVITPAEALRNLQQSHKKRKETVRPLFPVTLGGLNAEDAPHLTL